MGILEGLTECEIILHDHLEFMDSAPFSNGIEKDFIKLDHLLLSQWTFCLQGQLSYGIHDFCDIDLFWAANRTGLAGGTDPHGGTFENRVHIIDLDQTEYLIRLKIHLRGDRTSCRTFPALDALGDIFPIEGQDRVSELMDILTIQITQGDSPFSKSRIPKPPGHRSDHR
jgi:hypothetical protein